MAKPNIADLRHEVTLVRLLTEDWKKRGSPQPEGLTLASRLTNATVALSNEIDAHVPTLAELQHEIDVANALIEDWKRGRADPVEGVALAVRLTTAQTDLATATKEAGNITLETTIAPAPASPVTGHVEAVKARPKARPPVQHSSKDVLNKETNARFWAQTGYKVNQNLDPANNSTDRSMQKVWLDTFHKVEAEDRAGHLVTTYDHPDVQQHLQDAQVANQAAIGHLDAAAATQDPWESTQNVKAAATADAIGQQSAGKAAAYQPPTVSPTVANAAAIEAHHTAQQPPPGVVVFPVGHPAHWHPSAQPAHPDLTRIDPGPPFVPQSAADHLALDQAGKAGGRAGDVHGRSVPSADSSTNVSFPGGAAGPPLPPLPGGRSPDRKSKKEGMSTGTIATIVGAVVTAVGIGIAIAKSKGSSRGGGSPRAPRPRSPRAPSISPPRFPG